MAQDTDVAAQAGAVAREELTRQRLWMDHARRVQRRAAWGEWAQRRGTRRG